MAAARQGQWISPSTTNPWSLSCDAGPLLCAADASGFLLINEYLQSAGGPPEVFAVGDVASSVSDPRPKAGVYAVRQVSTQTQHHLLCQQTCMLLASTAPGMESKPILKSSSPTFSHIKPWQNMQFDAQACVLCVLCLPPQGPPLFDNLCRYLRGEPLQPYKPQQQALALISTGDRWAQLGQARTQQQWSCIKQLRYVSPCYITGHICQILQVTAACRSIAFLLPGPFSL